MLEVISASSHHIVHTQVTSSHSINFCYSSWPLCSTSDCTAILSWVHGVCGDWLTIYIWDRVRVREICITSIVGRRLLTLSSLFRSAADRPEDSCAEERDADGPHSGMLCCVMFCCACPFTALCCTYACASQKRSINLLRQCPVMLSLAA